MRDAPSPFQRSATQANATVSRDAAPRVRSSIRAALVTARRQWWVEPKVRMTLGALLVAAAYFFGSLVGMSVTFQSSPISPIWPPNTILLVALLLVPTQRWWAYLVAVLGAHLLVTLPNGIPPVTAIGWYFTNSAEAVVGASLVLRFTGGRPWLGSLRRAAVYIVSAVVAAPLLTSFADAAVVVLTHWDPNYWLSWETRTVSNSLAELTIGPALLLALTETRDWGQRVSRRRAVEAAFLTASVLLVSITVFGGVIAWRGSTPALVYAVLPLLLWAAIRFGIRGTTFALLGITVLATWSASQGHGPFSADKPAVNVISLQLYLIGISVPMLLLAGLLQEHRETEATLQESETRFRLMADQAPVMIWMDGPDSQCTYLNKVWLSFTGRTLEQELGTGWTESLHPDDRARCLEHYVNAFVARQPFEMEFRVRRHDGVYRWMVDSGVPRYTPNGEFEGYIGSLIDIADRKQTAEALERSEARYRDLVESQTEMICRYQPDSTLTFVNEAYCLYRGMSREQLLGKKFLDLMDDTAQEHHTRHIEALQHDQHVTVDEHSITLPNGKVAWQQWEDHAIRNEHGVVVEIQSIGRDITERKRAEAKLQESEERYRAVVSNFPHGIVLLFEQNLHHVFADGQGLSAFGPSRDAIEGKTVWEAFPTDLSRTLAPKYHAALAGEEAGFDLTYAGRTYQTHVQPVTFGGTSAGMAIMQDVTEQRRAEVLAELDRAKTAFFGNVSHELRTPLTLLLAPAADALADREEPLPPSQRKRLELIQHGAVRLRKLVDSLLTFSRIEAGQLQATYEATDLATLTTDLASTFRSAVERAGLRLVVDCAPLDDLSQPVYVDRDLWEQIVLNLLSNALKFTPAGEIMVSVRTTGDRNEQVQLEVRDTGTGISADEQRHIFERFYRAQNARTRMAEGTGIGLALVRDLARLHGGTVRVASEPGAGSTFTISLPAGTAHLPADRVAHSERPLGERSQQVGVSDAALFAQEALLRLPEPPHETLLELALDPTAWDGGAAVAPADVDAAASDREARDADSETWASTSGAYRPTILVADDNEDMRAYLVRLLSVHWHVRTAADGAEALAAARQLHPDLILADVIMPRRDGFALVSALRADPQTRGLPIILLSARAGDEATAEGLHAGAADYLIKPFSSRELLARVRTHLELARVRREAEERAAQLDAIFEAIGDGVLVCDRDWHEIYANPAYREILRRTLEIQGQQVDSDMMVAGREQWERCLTITDEQGRVVPATRWATERALQGETLTGSHAFDQFLRGTDGDVMQVNVSAAPIRDTSRRIIGSVAVFRDVTERRQLERQVVAQANQLAAIFEAIGDGVLVQDVDGNMRYANRAYHDLLRRHLELLGHHVEPDDLFTSPEQWEGLVAPADELGEAIPRDQWATERALRGETLTGKDAVDEFTRGAHGELLQLNVSAAPIRHADGRISGAVAVFRDVTERRQLEREVAEQASHLDAVFEAKADGVAVFDLQGRYLRSNGALREIFGMDADAEYTSLSLSERAQRLEIVDEHGQRIPEEQWPQWRVLRGEILAGASAMDARLRTLDGRERWISTTGAPLRGRDGEVTGVVLVTRDVTARRELERAAAEHASQLRAIFDTMTDGVFVLDEDGRVTRMNAAGRRLVGLRDGVEAVPTAEGRAGALDLRDDEGQRLPPDQLPTARLLRGEVLAGTTTQTYAMTVRSGPKEARTVAVRTVTLTGAPLRDIGSGQIYGAVAVFRDTTELKRTQTALAEQERLFRTLVENSPDIITRFDRNLRHLYVSPASEAVVGIPPDMRLHKTYAELGLPEEVYAPWERALREVFATGQRRTFETRYHAEGKPERVSRVTYVPELAADASVESVLGITTDITELKRTEEALRQSEERFASAFHQSPIPMAIVSRDTHRILDANAAQSRLTGFAHSELVGNTMARLGLLIPRSGQSGDRARREGGVFEVPISIRTKGGQERSCLQSMGFIHVGEEPCVIVTTRDVTEREHAEEELRRAKAAAEAAQHEEERRRAEAERRERIAASLRVILGMLNSDRRIDTTLDYITRQAGQLLGSDAAAIFMTSSGEARGERPDARTPLESLALRASFGLRAGLASSRGKHRLSIGDAAVRRAMETQRAIVVNGLPVVLTEGAGLSALSPGDGADTTDPVDAVSDLMAQMAQMTLSIPEEQSDVDAEIADYIEVRQELLPAPYRALLAIPITWQGQANGSLLLLYSAPRHFSDDEVALATAYGDQIALTVANSRLQEHIEREATENERNRLARELHDTVTQEIFTASVLSESIPKVWEHHRAEAEASLWEVHRLIRGALAALRAMLLELRPTVLEKKSLVELLQQLAEAMSTRANTPIELTVADDCPPLSNAVKVAFYRIAQEALMNTAKYANAHNIAVRLRRPRGAHEAIQLEVEDDGQGFDPREVSAGHFGLGMMRERARAAGATVRVKSGPDQGTRITVRWSEKA